MASDRYIILSDAIIDREKIVMVLRDNDRPDVVHAEFERHARLTVDGDDARVLWDAFDPNRDWRES